MIGTAQTRVPTGSVPAVSGPCSTISAQNSCPKTQSALGSSAGTPTDSINPVKWEKSANACRSEPQIPAASDRTMTCPEPGVTSATSPTTSWPPLITAARMVAPPPDLSSDRRWSLGVARVSHTHPLEACGPSLGRRRGALSLGRSISTGTRSGTTFRLLDGGQCEGLALLHECLDAPVADPRLARDALEDHAGGDAADRHEDPGMTE